MTIQVFVSTYGKYNNGYIKGEWIDLEQHDEDSFNEYIKELHSDEKDPEFMFQDYEGFPEAFYSESGLDSALWDWLDLDDDDRELLEAYHGAVDSKGTIEQAREAFYGKFDSDTEMAEEYAESTGMLSSMPDNLRYYFDFERFGRDLAHDFSEYNGFYFFNY